MKILISCLMISFALSALAGPAGVKNEDGTFKVTEKSILAMGITFQKLTTSGPWVFPKEALVKIKFTQGVYRKFEGNITFVIVSVINSNAQSVTIQSEDLEAGDEVAIKGTNFLRLTEADLNSETVDNCAH